MIENKEYFSIGLLKEAIEIQDFELWEIVMGIFHYFYILKTKRWIGVRQ